MTRVRFRHLLLIPDGEYELIQFDDDGRWVVRDAGGDVLVAEHSSPGEVVEVRCDFCGRWSSDAAPVPGAEGSWRCYGGSGPCPAPAATGAPTGAQ
jgi:hypothetical protein